MTTRMKTGLVCILALVSGALAGAGCGGSVSSGITVVISPQATTVSPGGIQQFTASVTGSDDQTVLFSVEEPGGGSIGADGLYTAPGSEGTFHVVAASGADPTKKDSAIVTVKVPVDRCQGVTCSGHGSCVVSEGNAFCQCETGYHAQGLSCVADTGPCQGVTCFGHGTCVGSSGVPACQCDSGYTGTGLVCYRSRQPSSAPACGNGTVEEDEQCDDGGTASGDGCSSGCRVELGANEVHPVLFVHPADRPALLGKLGAASIGGEVGSAFAAWIRSERHQPSIDFIRTALASANGQDIYTALLLYDVQHEFMTDLERTEFRSGFLADAQTIYDESVAVSTWYYVRRLVNNWTYRHAGAPLLRLLLPGIIFRADPRADALVDEGLKLVRWLFEVNPNNGTWNRTAQGFEAWPTQGEVNDEIVATPNSYGLWAADNLSWLNFIVQHSTGFDVFAHLDRSVYEWGRYWTYLLSFEEGLNWNGMDWYSFASYAGQTGHGDFGHIGYYSNAYMLHYAHAYNEPVFAWHYYANPSPIRFDGNYQASWNAPLDWYESWLQFLDWGKVGPQSPDSAGWPLSAFWPNAGVGVIRKSWQKKGPGSGIIWLRAGTGGSHDRPMYGAVQYHADDHVLLGAGPTSYDYEFLTRDPHVNNTLFIDDAGERGYYSQDTELDRLRHAHTDWLGPETFLMDMSPRADVDFQSAFVDHPYQVSWTRKVHYDRDRDILWIKDAASTSDGLSHQFRANWISDATMRAADAYELPAGYLMVARGSVPIVASERVYDQTAPEFAYKAIFAGGDGPAVRLWWAIGKDEAEARATLDAQRGVFVSYVRGRRDANGQLVVSWRTDEPSQGRVEFGSDASLGSTQAEGASALEHAVMLPDSAGQMVFYRIVAADSHGDETIAADANGPFVAIP